MGAPKGNQFWKIRSKHGRDKLFATPELLLEAATEYFEWVDNTPLLEDITYHFQGTIVHDNVEKKRPYTIGGLTIYLGVNPQYLDDFDRGLIGKDDKISKDFSVIITHIRNTIYTQKFEGAVSGFFNPNIIARDLHLRENTDITTDGDKINTDPTINIDLGEGNIKLK